MKKKINEKKEEGKEEIGKGKIVLINIEIQKKGVVL